MPKRFKPGPGFKEITDPETGRKWFSGHHHEHRSFGGRRNDKDESGHQQRIRRAGRFSGVGRRSIIASLQHIPFGHPNRLTSKGGDVRKKPKNHKSTEKAQEYRNDQ